MTHSDINSPVIEFLMRLRKMDSLAITARDVLLLYTIIANPGIHGKDAAHKISGTLERSGIHFGLARLMRMGFIEDRRPASEARRARPSAFHALPAGIEFWNELKP